MAPKIQASMVCQAAHSIAVTYAGAPYTITVAQYTAFASTDAILAEFVAQLASGGAGAWTAAVDTTGIVTITSPGLVFDWAWGASSELRDWLGYIADGAAAGPAWVARNPHEGGLYPSLPLQAGAEYAAVGLEATAYAMQTITGAHCAGYASTAMRAGRTLTLNLARTAAGAWTEISYYWAWLDYVLDGRPFVVWPVFADAASLTLRIGPVPELAMTPRWPMEYRYWQVSIPVIGVQS